MAQINLDLASKMNFNNPYSQMGPLVVEGLDYIIANLPKSPTEEDLNAAIFDFINSKFDFSTGTLNEMELKSILPIAMNAYINSDINRYSSEQSVFIDLLVKMMKNIPPLDIEKYINEVEKNFTVVGLSERDKTPLYFAASVGRSVCEYWIEKSSKPGDWKQYLHSNEAVNIANIPSLITAPIEAALFFTNYADYTTGPTIPPKISGPSFVTALTASLGLAAGKVIFKWMPAPTPYVLNRLNLINLCENIPDSTDPVEKATTGSGAFGWCSCPCCCCHNTCRCDNRQSNCRCDDKLSASSTSVPMF